MSESRQELVQWINDLLALNISKVEQCGTGAVYCQILDSIFQDVPMSKVKFDVNNEYQYLNNFKILQSVFTKHRISHPVPVERLVKCRLQDNLEFVQFMRRLWEANAPSHEYDAVSRRQGQAIAPEPHRQPSRAASRASTASRTTSRASTVGSSARVSSVTRSIPMRASMAPGGSASMMRELQEKVATLTKENEELGAALDAVQPERDFYFNKLRDIEVLIQAAAEEIASTENGQDTGDADADPQADPQGAANERFSSLIRGVQGVLYSTIEGFEIPNQEEEETF